MKRIFCLLLIVSLCFISGFCVADADSRIDRDHPQSESIYTSTESQETEAEETTAEPETEESTK